MKFLKLILFISISYIVVGQSGPEINFDGIVFPTMDTPPDPNDAVVGQVIYNTFLSEFQTYTGTAWVKLVDPPVSNIISDDDGDSYVRVFENGNLDFITFSLEGLHRLQLWSNALDFTRLELIDKGDNVSIGDDAGANLTADTGKSVYIGKNAGNGVTSGVENVMIGNGVGQNAQTSFNTLIGYQAGSEVTNRGISNTFVGHESGLVNTDGSNNSFFGQGTGESNLTGSGNSFFGFASGQNSTASNNSFFGIQSGNDISTGGSNTFVGAYSGSNVTTGNSNVYIGYQAGNKNTTGVDNVYIGYKAGESTTNRIGNRNIYIGNEVGRNTTENDKLRIDNQGTTDPLILGDFNTDELTVNGTLLVTSEMTLSGGLEVNSDVETNESNIFMRGLGSNDLDRGIKWSETADPVFAMIYDGEGFGGNNRLHIREYIGTSSDVMTIRADGNVGIGVDDPQQELDVDGGVRFRDLGGSGMVDVQANNAGDLIPVVSDGRLKKNIQTITSALEKVLALRGVSYEWIHQENQNKTLGVIAQEVLPVLPDVVTYTSEGYYGVNYSEMPALLIEAIKEQQIIIAQLKNELVSMDSSQALLEKRIIALEQLNNGQPTMEE